MVASTAASGGRADTSKSTTDRLSRSSPVTERDAVAGAQPTPRVLVGRTPPGDERNDPALHRREYGPRPSTPRLRNVYGIALSVEACLRAGTRVDVAWVVDADGLGARDRTRGAGHHPRRRPDRLARCPAPSTTSWPTWPLGVAVAAWSTCSVSDVDALVAGLSSAGPGAVPAGPRHRAAGRAVGAARRSPSRSAW